MSLIWAEVKKLLQDHRKEIGWGKSPCVRVSLKSGEKFLIARTIESSEAHYVALAYVPEETIDENPRFHFIAIDPREIYLIEAFEPEPRRPEQMKRISFVVPRETKDKTERVEKAPEKTP